MGCAGIRKHPAVLLDLCHTDPFGWVDNQHLTNQIFTVWTRRQGDLGQKWFSDDAELYIKRGSEELYLVT